MKSYKLRQITETALYSIENVLKDLQVNMETSWKKLLWESISVIFGGIGTSLVFDQHGFPTLIQYILGDNLETTSELVISIIYIVSIIIFFFLLSSFVFGVISIVNIVKAKFSNNKSTKEKRKELIEYFHTIILNDIFVGISFIQKYYEEKADIPIVGEIRIKKICGDNDLYLYEAYYYLKKAYDEIDSKDIFELKYSESNELFLDDIGVNTLYSMLKIFYRGCNELMKVISEGEERVQLEYIIKRIFMWEDDLKKRIIEE